MPYMADLRITLLDKTKREHQSHAVVLRLREALKHLNKEGVLLKVVEVPPGPPVLNTLVAEVYGSPLSDYEHLQQQALLLKQRLADEPFVEEVDTTVEDSFYRLRFVTDKQKAAISGVSTSDINQTLVMANNGLLAGFLAVDNEAKPLPLKVGLAVSDKATLNDFNGLQITGQSQLVQQSSSEGLSYSARPLVALAELGEFQQQLHEKSIFRKNLQPVVYVMAELNGRTPAEVIADVVSDQQLMASEQNNMLEEKPWQNRSFLNAGGNLPWQVADDITVVWTGEGEWNITVAVFRDMGIAFAFALVGIFFVLKIQTGSASLSLIIMSAIPLTIIGIMPGFWLLNMFGEREIAGNPDPVLFTATAMIGMIALAGIVVRNSLILVEFVMQARGEGLAIKEALIKAGAVRMRPVLLTAGTTLLGNLVIILDPVFSGLALAIIFGIIASTLFTLLVVPMVYYLVFNSDDYAGKALEKSGENYA
jgi:multidrug efflux pump subunit AcrB